MRDGLRRSDLAICLADRRMAALGASPHSNTATTKVRKLNAKPRLEYKGSPPLWAHAGRARSGSRRQPCAPRSIARSLHAGSLEQGPLDRPKAPSQAERCLGYPGSASAAGPETRSCLVQPRDRQQAPRLRSRPLASRRRMRRRQGAASWHRGSEKDWATGSVRNHGADPDLDP